jgi:hypothetical protein
MDSPDWQLQGNTTHFPIPAAAGLLQQMAGDAGRAAMRDPSPPDVLDASTRADSGTFGQKLGAFRTDKHQSVLCRHRITRGAGYAPCKRRMRNKPRYQDME